MRFRGPYSRRLAPAVLLVGVLAGAPAASADVGETIIQRCTHGQSLGGFSQSAYRQALKELSADAEEYTNCASLIRQAQLATAAGRTAAQSSPEGVAAVAATPSEKSSVTRAAHTSAAPVSVGGELVNPGVVHANVSSAFNSLPDSLLATVAFLLACLALLAGGAVRNRFRGRD